ncbi:MAG: FAD-dependent oxidoreductase [Thermoanaerobaculales bacterium]
MSQSWTPRALVVGSGLAGLTCAHGLAADGWHVEVVSPGRAGRDGATHRVHALAPWILLTAPWVRGDSPARFLAELVRRSDGMAHDGLAEVLAEEANPAARQLAEELGLEAVSSEPDLLPGDEIPRGMRFFPRHRNALLSPLLLACTEAGVRVRERTLVLALLTGDGRAVGVVAIDRARERTEQLAADAVVLACGGAGAVFPVTTAPRWCRGSGLAVAARAGVLLHHPENTQALPVTATPPLYFPTSAAITRGRITVGGRRLDAAGSLEDATLEIARAQLAGLEAFLEPSDGAREALPQRVRESAAFRSFGRVPLTVAAHHGVGGVAVDAWGRTSMPGLYACGEAAGGVQGRRRTMGTGLLEAAIFARRAAQAMRRDVDRSGPAPTATQVHLLELPTAPGELETALDALMGPLVVLRQSGMVDAAWNELQAWPTSTGDGFDSKAALAALRREAALAMLAPCAKRSGLARAQASIELGR